MLDDVPVDDKAFPLNKWQDNPKLSVVGHCPCGAPVYGLPHVLKSEKIEIRYSCECNSRVGKVENK